jgi:hypothetical protein
LLLGDFHHLQPDVTAYAVVFVDYRRAGIKVLQIAQDRRRVKTGAFAATLLARTLAKQLRIGQQHQRWV